MTRVTKKYVLLLSDGRTEPADFPPLLAQLVAAGVVVSVVGIGLDVDRAFLEQIAALGGGRAYFSEIATALPAIFMREATFMTGKWLVECRFTPHVVTPHEILAGLDVTTLPALTGYVASTLKPHAQLVLGSDTLEPIIASWRFGLGKTLVFTSDLASPWTAEWRQWASFGPLWTQMVCWASRRIYPEQLLHPHITLQGTTARLLVEALEDSGRFRKFLYLRALAHPPDAVPQAIQLYQTASGSYEGHFEVERTGTYLLSLTAAETAAAEPLQTAYTSLHVATLPEHQTVHANLPLLQEIARTARGAVLTLQDSPFRRPASGTTYIDAGQFPVIMALILFLFDVAIRRGIRFRDLGWWRRQRGRDLTGARMSGE